MCNPTAGMVRPENGPSRGRAIYPRLGTFHGEATLTAFEYEVLRKGDGLFGSLAPPTVTDSLVEPLRLCVFA